MGKIKEYFFDTYAIFEMIHNNKNYLYYTKNIGIITTKLNLMELHYRLIALYGKDIANKAYERFKNFCVEIDDDVIKEANKFKLINKKRRLSYIDCIGYMIARYRNVRFLTGDIQFKNLDNVEFVK